MKFKIGVIDHAIEKETAHEKNSMEILDQMGAEQPALAAYLAQENFSLLTEEEHDYLIFLVTVIYRLYAAKFPNLPMIDEDLLDEVEEINWDKMAAVTEKKFNKRIDAFFTDFEEEDLLAFVEDALTEDEIGLVTKEGREPIFIAAKTVIDAFDRLAEEGEC